MEETGRMQSA